jgi:hypothetical protein
MVRLRFFCFLGPIIDSSYSVGYKLSKLQLSLVYMKKIALQSP